MRRREVKELLCDGGAVLNSELRLSAVPLRGEGHTSGRLGTPSADTEPTPVVFSPCGASCPPPAPVPRAGGLHCSPTSWGVLSTLALDECGMAADALLLL